MLHAQYYANGIKYNHRTITEIDPGCFRPHIHDAYEVIMILRGEVTYMVEGRRYRLKRGDLVLSLPSVYHDILPTDGIPYERHNILVDSSAIPAAIRRMIPSDTDVFDTAEDGATAELFDRLGQYATRLTGEARDIAIGAVIAEIMIRLSLYEKGDAAGRFQNRTVGRALGYIHENLAAIQSVEEVCQALYITKSHIHHLFKEHIGVTPKRYIISKKLSEARRLIRRGERPTEVYIKLGFGDYASFYRNYKRLYGYGPSEELMHSANGDEMI